MLRPSLEAFIQRMPKVELHLHLEGTVTPRTLLELARRNRVQLPVSDEASLAALFRYQDFGAFIDLFMSLARVLMYGEDFERLAYELGHDLAAQQVCYAEVMLSPMQHLNRGLDLGEVIAGTRAGFERVRQELGLEVGLIMDYGRQYGPEGAWAVLEVACAHRHLGVVGWSIGGNEIGYPPEPFAPVFAAARAAGLGLTAHAGEVVGPPSVWGAVDALGATRLGHGIRSVDDPALLKALRERQIVLDICPSSNLFTGAVADWPAHPLRQLYAAGIPVTINSDDPTFFATTLTDEYRLAITTLGLSIDELCATLQTAAHSSFQPAEARVALAKRIEAELTALRTELGV